MNRSICFFSRPFLDHLCHGRHVSGMPTRPFSPFHARTSWRTLRDESGDAFLKQQEKNGIHSRLWFIYLPFQNAPGPRSSEADRHRSESLWQTSDISPTTPNARQSGIRFDRCIDTDRCLFIIPEESTTRAERRMMVELFGTDVPSSSRELRTGTGFGDTRHGNVTTNSLGGLRD